MVSLELDHNMMYRPRPLVCRVGDITIKCVLLSPMTKPSPLPANALLYRPVLMQGRWFSEIGDALQQRLLGAAIVRRLGNKERLFSRGDPPCGLYAVVEGVIQISGMNSRSEVEKEAVLTLVEPPDWFGEIALFDSLPRTHDAFADGPAVVLQIPQAAISALLRDHPAFWRELGLLMSHKLRLAFAAMEETALLPAPVRLASRLLLMTEGYGGRHDVTLQRRILKLSQEQLSRLLGITRQTTNQILKNLEQRHIIRLHRNEIEILDRDQLRAVVSGDEKFS